MSYRTLFFLYIIAAALSGCAQKIILQSKAPSDELEIFMVSGYKASSKSGDTINLRSVYDGNLKSAWESKPLQNPAWVSVKFKNEVKLNAVRIHWGGEAADQYDIQVSDNEQIWKSVAEVTDGQPNEKRTVRFSPVKCQSVRVFCKHNTGGDFYTIREIELNPSDAVSAVKATASSSEGENVPDKAIDGDSATRWSSEGGQDPSWLALDLGKKMKIGSVKIKWEKAAAKVYDIQVSDDGENWKTAASIDDGAESETRVIQLEPGVQARFIRMLGKKRATEWGYSIWEMELFSPGLFVSP